MAETKPLPPSASAEGETAALQAQIIEAGTIDAKSAGKNETAASEPKKGSDSGLKNYFASLGCNGLLTLANTAIARLQVWNST